MFHKLSSTTKLLIILFPFLLLCILLSFILFSPQGYNLSIPHRNHTVTNIPPSKLVKTKQPLREECFKLPKILGVQAPLCVKANDELVSKSVRDGGLWERKVLTMVLKALSKLPSSVLIDGGANVGEFTVMAAAMGHQVIAVEPMVDNIQVLGI